MKIGGPQITLLASDHPQMAHSSNLGPFFTSIHLYLLPSYIMLTSCTFRFRKGGGQELTYLAPFVLQFLEGLVVKSRAHAAAD
eukprot:28622-Pelagomonas_calceolata.AAC.2